MYGTADPFSIEPATQEWAYGDIEGDFRARRYVWREVSGGFLDQALNVMPPIYAPGGFMVGEAWSHNANDEPLYAAFAQVGRRCFAIISTVGGFPWRRQGLARALKEAA